MFNSYKGTINDSHVYIEAPVKGIKKKIENGISVNDSTPA
jgi:hypothetical protein